MHRSIDVSAYLNDWKDREHSQKKSEDACFDTVSSLSVRRNTEAPLCVSLKVVRSVLHCLRHYHNLCVQIVTSVTNRRSLHYYITLSHKISEIHQFNKLTIKDRTIRMKVASLACIYVLATSTLCSAFAPHARLATSKATITGNGASSLSMVDYPKPNVENTDNYRFAEDMSSSFKSSLKIKSDGQKKKVAIIGGGLSGLSCAKYLTDAGHQPTVYEARNVLGGKVSAWQDADGDWIETGLHIFFGAYPNMMNMFAELGIHDRLQWKIHKMIFAMQELPGEFTSFDFIPGIPAPFNFGLAILMNQKMLTLGEKIQTAPPLLPMLIQGQDFIDAQDELSVTQFMRKYGMPERINEEVFISMAKALDFIDPDKLSMTVVLTAMNRFLNEDNGLQMAFLDGNQPDRVCEPMKQSIESKGGKVLTSSPIQEIVTNDDGSIAHLLLRTGEKVVADEYVSAMPVDVIKRMTPEKWQNMPYFRQFDELEGIPVINLHMWFDRKLTAVDHLCFSRSPLLSVYADMSVTCKEYLDPDKSMLELVFAPCSPLAGGNTNWISKSDEDIIDATMGELSRLFPKDIANDEKWPATSGQGSEGKAKLLKFAVVKVPRSVYAAIPGASYFVCMDISSTSRSVPSYLKFTVHSI